MRFIIVDGKIIEKKEVVLTEEITNNRFTLSQKMWYGYGGIPLFTENIELLKQQAAVLKTPFPSEFGDNRELFRLIKRMLNKNRFYRSGHIHLQIFYGNDSIHTLVSCTTFTGFTFPFSEEGLLGAFSTQKKFTQNAMNRLPFFNERLWQGALAEIQGTPFKQSIILNDRDSAWECAFCSLFIVSQNELITPSHLSGCHENALRRFVIEAAVNLGLKPNEAAFISPDEILEADEIFCASEEFGIQWILGVEQQRFIHYYSEKIAEELDLLLKAKAGTNQL